MDTSDTEYNCNTDRICLFQTVYKSLAVCQHQGTCEYCRSVSYLHASECTRILSDLPSDLQKLLRAVWSISVPPDLCEPLFLPAGPSYIPEQYAWGAHEKHYDYRSRRGMQCGDEGIGTEYKAGFKTLLHY